MLSLIVLFSLLLKRTLTSDPLFLFLRSIGEFNYSFDRFWIICWGDNCCDIIIGLLLLIFFDFSSFKEILVFCIKDPMSCIWNFLPVWLVCVDVKMLIEVPLWILVMSLLNWILFDFVWRFILFLEFLLMNNADLSSLRWL